MAIDAAGCLDERVSGSNCSFPGLVDLLLIRRDSIWSIVLASWLHVSDACLAAAPLPCSAPAVGCCAFLTPAPCLLPHPSTVGMQCRDSKGRTPLMVACNRAERFEAARALLQLGADVALRSLGELSAPRV